MNLWHIRLARLTIRGLCSAALILFLMSASFHANSPQTEIRVVSSRAVQLSNQEIRFSLNASSTETIEKVILVYGVSGHGCNSDATRRNLSVDPNQNVQAEWKWELDQTGFFLPGLEIWWQWEIQAQDGTQITTDRETLVLMDMNHKWNQLEEGKIRLYWYEGNQLFGKQLMAIAQRSLKRLEEKAGVTAQNNLRILVYSSFDEMRSMLADVAEWVGGVTYGEYDLVIIGIPTGEGMNWANEVIPHELAHLISETGFINCQSIRLPIWLMEGIATYAEGLPDSQERRLVKRALDENRLPALKTMRYSFPEDKDEAELAYAQSHMVVTYLIETYGVENMNALVEAIRNGKTIDQALRPIYGMNTETLDQAWRADQGYGDAPELIYATETPAPTRTPIPTLDLHPSVFNATPSPTITSTPLLSPTATAAVPTAAKTALAPADTGPAHTPEPSNLRIRNLVLGLVLGLTCLGGILIAVILAGVGVWYSRKQVRG